MANLMARVTSSGDRASDRHITQMCRTMLPVSHFAALQIPTANLRLQQARLSWDCRPPARWAVAFPIPKAGTWKLALATGGNRLV